MPVCPANNLQPQNQCVDKGGDKNYCTQWCNNDGKWGCGIATDNNYTCNCAGCGPMSPKKWNYTGNYVKQNTPGWGNMNNAATTSNDSPPVPLNCAHGSNAGCKLDESLPLPSGYITADGRPEDSYCQYNCWNPGNTGGTGMCYEYKCIPGSVDIPWWYYI
jgi:hypothetical protein